MMNMISFIPISILCYIYRIMSVFSLEKHVKYFQYHLQCVPAPYISLDSSRLTILYFCLSGLDILNKLELTEFQRESICSFVYSLQVVPDNQDVSRCGFRGSPFIGCCFSHAGSKSMNGMERRCKNVVLVSRV